jgi:hypothetical protein
MVEIEYRAIALGVAEMLWLKKLLKDFKVNHGEKIKLQCDNKSAINITNNHVHHERIKHVKIDRFS